MSAVVEAASGQPEVPQHAVDASTAVEDGRNCLARSNCDLALAQTPNDATLSSSGEVSARGLEQTAA